MTQILSKVQKYLLISHHNSNKSIKTNVHIMWECIVRNTMISVYTHIKTITHSQVKESFKIYTDQVGQKREIRAPHCQDCTPIPEMNTFVECYCRIDHIPMLLKWKTTKAFQPSCNIVLYYVQHDCDILSSQFHLHSSNPAQCYGHLAMSRAHSKSMLLNHVVVQMSNEPRHR